MRIQARAKINWTLDIVGVREDGYHLLDMLMQPISLCDTLTLTEAPGLFLRVEGAPELDAGENNLALRAARALQAAVNVNRGAEIVLTKHIPMGAGLGGGSADAAGVLKGLNQLWQLDLSLEDLCRVGVTLGADVPYCLHDAPQRARSIGEHLSPFESRVYPLVLIQPCAGLSTREVYAAYHAVSAPPRPRTDAAMDALRAGDLTALRHCGGNVLEAASIPLRPEILTAKQALCGAGAAFAQMTGSGSVVFGAFSSPAAARQAYDQLKQVYDTCILTDTAL